MSYRCSFILIALLLSPGIAPATEVAIVRSSEAEPYSQAEAALQQQLAAHHIATHSYLAKEVADKSADAGPQSVIGHPDAVVAIGTPAARWLHSHLPPETRLIYCMVSNPADVGLTEGNPAWGVTIDVALGDQFKLIAEALPHARSIGLLYRSDTDAGKAELEKFKKALPDGWNVQAVAVNDNATIADAISNLNDKHPDLIWTSADQKIYDTAAVRVLLLTALRNHTPVWGFSPAFVRAGALLGVGIEPKSQGEQAANLVQHVLGNAKPPEQRAQPPQSFEVHVNLVAAQQLGVDLPEGLINRATQVIRPEK